MSGDDETGASSRRLAAYPFPLRRVEGAHCACADARVYEGVSRVDREVHGYWTSFAVCKSKNLTLSPHPPHAVNERGNSRTKIPHSLVTQIKKLTDYSPSNAGARNRQRIVHKRMHDRLGRHACLIRQIYVFISPNHQASKTLSIPNKTIRN